MEKITTLEFDSIICETDRAVLYVLGGEKIWIPKSAIVDIDTEHNEVDVYTWFAEKRQLI